MSVHSEGKGGSRIPCRRVCRHTILPNFPENCMKLGKFWAVGEDGAREKANAKTKIRASSSYFFLFFPIFLSILLFFLFFSNFLLFSYFFWPFLLLDTLKNEYE